MADGDDSRIIAVVGGVAGGASFAARARRLDERARIIMFERGPHISFANCGLPYYISGEIADRQKLLIQTPERFARRFRVDVRVNSEVLSIDPDAKVLEVLDRSTGRKYQERYDKLVLSPGAAPLRPPLPGMDHPRIFSLRTVEDADAIRNFVEKNDPRSVVVVGGGFIGLEMAENLHRFGLRITVVEMADQVLLGLDREMAELVHQHLRMQQVELMLGNPVQAFESLAEQRLAVKVRNGETIPCDFVVSAIGVKPEAGLARQAGLELGKRGEIRVNEHLQTSNPDIYAIGDAIGVEDRIIGQRRLIPLAGLANKQGRIAADHMLGQSRSFRGALGSGIVRVFDLSVASTGANERSLRANNVPYQKSYTHPASHAGYYPGAVPMVIKLLFTPASGKILGAQIVGVDGVDKRIDVLATAIYAGLTVFELMELELAYAPQYGTGKDAVNLAGYVASNVVERTVNLFHTEDIEALLEQGGFLLDVRTAGEFERAHIQGAVNIPIDELRDKLQELPHDRLILAYCLTGVRSYLACRILMQNGFQVRNLSGGYVMYCAANLSACAEIPGLRRWKRVLALETFCSTPEERSVVQRAR